MSFAPPPAATADYAMERSRSASPSASNIQERPGLGTQLGHELNDASTATFFHRKSDRLPDAVATFHYNDEEGARLMAALSGRATRRDGPFDLVPGKLRASVCPTWWRASDAFDHYQAGGKVFVIGSPGSQYQLKFENRTNQRMEIVVSVDGLNVLDGQTASVRKRGYVIPAKSEVAIRGMRVGGRLKSFVFSSVAQSRAATAFGESGARNVGVIGVACYEEDETARRRQRVEENYLRSGARAFGQ